MQRSHSNTPGGRAPWFSALALGTGLVAVAMLGCEAVDGELDEAEATAGQLSIAWNDNASNEDGYRVERKTGTGGTYAVVATVAASATTFTDPGLAAAQTYCYRVRAFNAAGTSAYTNETCGTTPAAPAGAVTITLDNLPAGQADAQRAFAGRWCTSQLAGYFGTRGLYACGGSSDTYTFRPTIATAGQYDVHFRYLAHPNRSSAVPVRVTHAGGVTEKRIDQRVGGSQWVLHGRYSFAAGTTGSLRFLRPSTGAVSVDGARFTPVVAP